MSDKTPAKEFNGASLVHAVSISTPLSLAEATAEELIAMEKLAKAAQQHRARSDLFGVKLGEKVTVEQVNQFLQENGGKPLKSYEKIQLAKVIQELMKEENAELWQELDGFEYQCKITTKMRGDKKDRCFVLSTVGSSEVLKKGSKTNIPENLRLIPAEQQP